MEIKDIVKEIYTALDDKMAEDITILDIREISVMADYFIIANSDNTSQMNAMKNAVENVMAMHGINAQQIEGGNNSSWILMDYEDVIVHLFSRDDRLFYNLERIWQDGKKVSIEEL
ncbi:MAG: ribosome silencing factor [Lachnospiraceae bacterium]|nr:ribosome silencing factor [Lachnospiraceae bacterium]